MIHYGRFIMKRTYTIVGFLFLCIILLSSCGSSAKVNYDVQVDNIGIMFDIPEGYEIDINSETEIFGHSKDVLFRNTTDTLNTIGFMVGTFTHIRINNQGDVERFTHELKKNIQKNYPEVENVFSQERKVIQGAIFRFIKIKLKLKMEGNNLNYVTFYILPLENRSLIVGVTSYNDEEKDFEELVKNISIGYIK